MSPSSPLSPPPPRGWETQSPKVAYGVETWLVVAQRGPGLWFTETLPLLPAGPRPHKGV